MTWERFIPAKGLAPRKLISVSRNNRGNAYFVIPLDMMEVGTRVDYYQSGSKLGFKPSDHGLYKISNDSRLTIPRRLSGSVPLGTRDIIHSEEGGMFVVDLDNLEFPK